MANSTIAPPHESTPADSGTSTPSLPSILRIHSSTKSRSPRIGGPGTPISCALGNATQTSGAVPADQGGLPFQVQFKTTCLAIEVVQDLSAEMRPNNLASISEVADIHSLLSNVLAQIVDRIRGTPLRSGYSLKQPLTTVEVEIISNIAPVESAATTLRVGALELDLIDRTARRGGRSFNLRPCEFRLLKYMMQRCGQLLTRAKLFEDVWNYKFSPETNLVDVQLGRLRRKVDASNETPMIHNIRGAGFVLSATE
jgi:DNA-binding winged helix-turn-helix (wHTH) protein